MAQIVTLRWVDNADNETAFYIYRRTVNPDGSWISIGSVGANVTSFIDVSVVPGTSYEYSVVAVNSAGQSSPAIAPVVTVTPTVTIPAAPSGLTAVVSG